MKKLTTIICLAFAGTILAQGDTTRFKMGGVEFIIVDNDTMMVEDNEDAPEDFDGERFTGDMTYWSGFEVGVNMLLNNSQQPEFSSSHLEIDPAQSFSYSFNLMEQKIRIVKDYVGIVTGIGFTNSRYGFKDDHMRLMANSDSTWGYHDSTLTSGFNKNQLRVNYFNIPILLQFNTSKYENKNFHISLGVIGGIRMNSKVKYVYDVLGGENDHKEKGRYNINPFQASATVRLGYRDFGLFANYNLLTLYEKGTSEVAYPLTFGASFHF